ncbi:hypothetical protein E4U21_006851 [Claviceps maximensis]|nr:hypothetical protein E4U21_006851 [Claviceps maximensis]
MDPQGHGQDHTGPGTNAVAWPPTQSMNFNANVPALEQNQLPVANPGVFPVIMDGQPFNVENQGASLNGHAMPLGSTSGFVPMMMANGGSTQIPPLNTISPDDVALYDRQIRLWGMAAQQKIQNSHILLITMRGLANEVAKNLVLAGVGSITLLDGSPVTEVDLGCQFLLSDGGESLVGQNRAEAASHALRKLNPRVQVHVDAESVTTKGPSYYAAFDVVIATDLDPDAFNIINTATRINGRPFYAAGTHGMYGFIFSDLIEHDYVIEREASNVATTPKRESRTRSIVDVKTKTQGLKSIESVTKRELYSTWYLSSDAAVLPAEYTASKRRLKSVTPALSCLRALWEFKQLQGDRLPSNRDDLKLFTQLATQKHKALSLPSETLRPEFLRSFLQNLDGEIAPVTAVLGGQLSQDVINVLGQSQQPIQNTVIFDGTTMEAPMYPLHPELDLGASLLSVPNAGPSMQNTIVVGGETGFGAGASIMATNNMPMYSYTNDAMHHPLVTSIPSHSRVMNSSNEAAQSHPYEAQMQNHQASFSAAAAPASSPGQAGYQHPSQRPL